ncbi:nitroreductase family deazaflavin-dependent oxidoreductase [Streptomyces finlayi]|uniref:Nitroreductase family deazaflavin-dependent oxidoreductase n=1 Tax=Streptomyces finlayi TaxID=67296 RepID=A0A7G7BK21_9ACTN|nr:nitroreductase family deazaflavin-dependent oxidoreductase [Streptomyces finlayi]QNE75686.1 nitroreductase family deazaflavin-dependent oxidoreductase [Streptomyces finlayi]
MAPGARSARKAVQKISSTRAFARIAPHVIPVMDRTVHRLTRGRVMLSAQMLPGLVLTVRGAKSGQLRTVPLACMPQEGTRKGAPEGWILVGSNFGRTGHPAWTANLLGCPDAVVSWKGRDVPVRARLLQGAERAEVWEAALRFWPPYATYQARIEREIRLFRLERGD